MGQPLSFHRVVNPRKDTQTAKTPTKRKQASILEKIRTHIAGSSSNSADSQLAR